MNCKEKVPISAPMFKKEKLRERAKESIFWTGERDSGGGGEGFSKADSFLELEGSYQESKHPERQEFRGHLTFRRRS